MDTQSLSTERLLELTKTETNKESQKAIIRELVTRGAATVITPTDDQRSIRRKVMAVTPGNSIPQEWLD
jgi:hypothetical protein